jgi:SAM-dependent methyltransferase
VIQRQHVEMPDSRCGIDVCPSSRLAGIELISGWHLPKDAEDYRVEVRINGSGAAELLRTHRHDVADAFPDIPKAVRSGFIGDVVVPDDIQEGETVMLSLHAVSPSNEHSLFTKKLRMMPRDRSMIKARYKVWGDIFLDPSTAEPVSFDGLQLRTTFRASGIPVIAGVPHFLPRGKLPLIRLIESGTTHPYSEVANQIISNCDGLVLVFGAGIQAPDRLRENVLNLDGVQFPYVDVVNRFRTLPFRSNVFDAVISQAVFEHLADPFEAAREIYRVLRPGGQVLIDTAFMQPYHGDPNHYFNMTQAGLREVMAGFRIEDIGVRPYQNPSYGLRMQIEAVLPFLRSGKWSSLLQGFLEELQRDGEGLDEALGEVGREVLAAGVYVLARKAA